MTPSEAWMREAVELARRGEGTVAPNPMVGAVIVQDEIITGRGWHERAGEPHAEIRAIADARKRSDSLAGATLVVTLEPCSTHGRTPPCTEAIIREGFAQVIIGAIDPNPDHQGRAIQLLEKSGIRVVTGVLESECRALLDSWKTFRDVGRVRR